MVDQLSNSLAISSSGLEAQATRLRIVSENIANSNSTSSLPGGDPYRRKLVNFETQINRLSGVSEVKVSAISRDFTPFRIEHIPGHPAANADGIVRLPNVNSIIEMADMREANHSYQANLQVFKQTRELINLTIDMMRQGR